MTEQSFRGGPLLMVAIAVMASGQASAREPLEGWQSCCGAVCLSVADRLLAAR